MTVDQLVKSLMPYNPDAEITLYDSENDRECIKAISRNINTEFVII